MDRTELKQRVADLLRQGHPLAEIQTILRRDDHATMTFLDLRLLASEIEGMDWGKGAAATADAEALDDDPETVTKADLVDTGTVVEISSLARPGAAMSGSVRFGSGATADWVLDTYGRLTLENAKGQPTPDDVRGFQEELQRKLGGMG